MAAAAHGHIGQPGAAMLPPQPQAVGSQFVQQYYSVLHKQPHYLHRFYTDQSTMTYFEAGGQEAVVINSQQKIHDKVMSLGYQDAVTEIFSVDSQYSLSDGVIVQVTGSLQCASRPKKNFTQTFFLAVQEKGYFVLNDLFRVLPEPPSAAHGYGRETGGPQENGYTAPPASLHPPPIEHPPQLNGAQQVMHASTPPPQPAPPIPAPAATAPQQPQASAPPPVAQAPAAAPQQQAPTPPPVEATAPKEAEPEAAPEADAAPIAQDEAAPAATDASQPEAEAEAASAPPAEPAAPLTYAERLKQGAKAVPKPQPPRPAPQPKPAVDSATPAATAPSADGNGVDGAAPGSGYGGQEEAPGRSIFVKDLPVDITPERLAQAFAEFGELVPSNRAVNLKAQKDKPPFAFIEFKEESAAAAAITGPVVIDGHTVRVDEKKPLYILRGGRGGRGGEYGRGTGRFDGGGRGYYGRGPGRGEFVPRGGYPVQDGGRGRGPPGGRGPRPMGGRGNGPPRDSAGRGGRAGAGGRGPRPPAPGGPLPPSAAAPTPAEAGAAAS